MIFVQGDCVDVLRGSEELFDLVVTDPPYNIKWVYGSHLNDERPDYDEWCEEWAGLLLDCLRPGGVLCVINYPENNNVLYTALRARTDAEFLQQLIWHYPTNVGHSKRRYTRSHRTILVYVKKGAEHTFNPEKQPYKNPNDKRIKALIEAGSKGANHYDVIEVNLCKNVSSTKKIEGMNQLPDDLCEFLIRSFSNPGDKVLDPFAGTMTVPRVAEILGREGIGIDLNKYSARMYHD